MQGVLDTSCGVLIAPNHAAHYDSAALYLAADAIKTPLYYMTAWQVFGMASRWEQFLMQRLGCFSIDRESTDRSAYKQAVSILRKESCPLVVFPEGDIYHTTDRVTPFREGAAAIAISAARREAIARIAVVPCGIKFWYTDDPSTKLAEVDERIGRCVCSCDRSCNNLWQARIYRFAEAVLALKEIEYLGATRSGKLVDRISHLAQSILEELEVRHELVSNAKCRPRAREGIAAADHWQSARTLSARAVQRRNR